MKNLLPSLFLLLILSSCGSKSTTDNPATTTESKTGSTADAGMGATVKEQAESMGKLLLAKDFKGFVKFTHPTLVSMMGGEDKMIEVLKNGFEAIGSEGAAILSVSIGEPSAIITSGEELQCTVPQTLIMKVPTGKMKNESTLVGVSMDKGAHWYFIDANADAATLRNSFPNLSDKLVIPEKKQPEMIQE